jgi:hypothetical protein
MSVYSQQHIQVYTLDRCYYKGIKANIELQVYSVPRCSPYIDV